MWKRKSLFIGALFVVALGVWSGLRAQERAGDAEDPAPPVQDLSERVDVLGERLLGVEKLLAGLIASPDERMSSSLETRLDRIESRLVRLEAEATRSRPGTPASSAQVEGRLRALEREVARLRR